MNISHLTDPLEDTDTDTGVSRPTDPRAELPSRVSDAARQIMDPIAQLFVSHGVAYAQAEALLKESFLAASQRELARAGISSNVSRLSVSSGLNRKEVRRLTQEQAEESSGNGLTPGSVRQPIPPACALYTRWLTDPSWRKRNQPDVLPIRTDDGSPSFESLAREVSSDSHPRALLEELRRLGLAELSEDKKFVALASSGFVPLLERTEMLGLLADNLADHATTAVLNVIEPENRHLEQAVFCENLSEESVRTLHERAREIWIKTMEELVSAMSAMEKRDAGVDEEQEGSQTMHRIRVGMYCFTSTPRGQEEDDQL